MPDLPSDRPHAAIFAEPRRPRSEARTRGMALLALLVAGAAGIAGTMWFAVGWAADLPKTIAFAIEQEPFGSRSLLARDNAHAALEQLTARVGPEDEVTDLHLTAERLSLTVRDPEGRRRMLGTTIVGDVEDYFTWGPSRRRGVPVRRIAAVDLDAALGAAQDRWRSIRPRTHPPLLSLRMQPRRLNGWAVIFSGEVPASERTTEFDLRGRRIG